MGDNNTRMGAEPGKFGGKKILEKKSSLTTIYLSFCDKRKK
jgi:hypothetical protein